MHGTEIEVVKKRISEACRKKQKCLPGASKADSAGKLTLFRILNKKKMHLWVVA